MILRLANKLVRRGLIAECLALVADTSLSGVRVARELDRRLEERGRPEMVVNDNGSEFTSNAILGWADAARVEWHYIAPGNPSHRALRIPVTLKQPQADAVSFIYELLDVSITQYEVCLRGICMLHALWWQ